MRRDKWEKKKKEEEEEEEFKKESKKNYYNKHHLHIHVINIHTILGHDRAFTTAHAFAVLPVDLPPVAVLRSEHRIAWQVGSRDLPVYKI